MVKTDISLKDIKELYESGLRTKEKFKELLNNFSKEDFINYMVEEDEEENEVELLEDGSGEQESSEW